MLKLMKYEFRKTWFTKVILLAITAIAEIVYLIGLYADREGLLATGVFLLMLLAVGGLLVIGLGSVVTLHRDMNTKQSYMLFMTPNSCYSILGAKVLECGISILLTGAVFFALGTLDVTLLFARNGELKALWDWVRELLSSITVSGRPLLGDIRLQSLLSVSFSLLAGWLLTVTTIYLAVVISSAILNGKRFSGLISFVLFLVLSWGCARLASLISGHIGDLFTLMLVNGLISLVFSAIMYFVTAQIMEKRLSV